MKDKTFYELHRSTAVKILLSVDRNPTQYTNLRLAEMLEEKFPAKSETRSYIVKEDIVPLGSKALTLSNF